MTYAATPQTVVITGQDLYNLIVHTNSWIASYTVDGKTYNMSRDNVEVDSNGYLVCTFEGTSNSAGSSFGTLGNINIGVEPSISYTGVSNVSSELGAGFTLIAQTPNGFSEGSHVNNYTFTGYAIDTSNVQHSLGSFPVSASNGTVTTTLFTNIQMAKLNGTLNSVDLSSLLFSGLYSGSFDKTQYTSFTMKTQQLVIKNITVTFSGSSGGGEGGGSDTPGSGSYEDLIEEIKKGQEAQQEYYNQMMYPTPEDDAIVSEREEQFSSVQSEAAEFNNVMDSLEKPSIGEVLPELPEDFDTGESSLFSKIMGSFFGSQFILTILISSLGITTVAYILYGKRA